MSRAVMQEFLRSKPYGDPEIFEGDDFDDVTLQVFMRVTETNSARTAVTFMMKWLQGQPYAEKLGSFCVREYEPGTVGVWYEWTYTD